MSNELKSAIGFRVQAARKAAGISQEELAARIERHKDSVSLIERGETMPTLPMLLAISEAVETSLQELLPSETKRAAQSKRRTKLEVEIMHLVRRVPEKRLHIAKEQLELLLKIPD